LNACFTVLSLIAATLGCSPASAFAQDDSNGAEPTGTGVIQKQFVTVGDIHVVTKSQARGHIGALGLLAGTIGMEIAFPLLSPISGLIGGFTGSRLGQSDRYVVPVLHNVSEETLKEVEPKAASCAQKQIDLIQSMINSGKVQSALFQFYLLDPADYTGYNHELHYFEMKRPKHSLVLGEHLTHIFEEAGTFGRKKHYVPFAAIPAELDEKGQLTINTYQLPDAKDAICVTATEEQILKPVSTKSVERLREVD